MTITTVIGMLAAFLTTASFLPQAVLVLRTRNTSGISLTMYAMFTLGVAAWLLYGIALGSAPMVIANAITFALAALILSMKARATLFLPRAPTAPGLTSSPPAAGPPNG